ncbi:MAG: Qat anti-phage system associated protein QatB [Ktedonobacteraceae bacterium]
MGTSSSYSGPTGTTSLLPPWTEEPMAPVPLGGEKSPAAESEPLGIDTPLPQISWRVPKAALSRLASGAATGLGTAALAALGRSYVQASDGAHTAAASASAGRASSARLGGFLAEGVRNGFHEAVRNIGLETFIGQDAQYVLAAFIDMIAPNGALREEAIARAAMIETCTAIFDQYDVEGGGIDALDAMEAEGVQAIVGLSVTNYVNVRLQEELVNRIERGALNEEEANTLMCEIKDFIAGVVRLDLREIDVLALDWGSPEGYQVVQRIYETGYEMLGGTE